jgi:hypothetical protein
MLSETIDEIVVGATARRAARLTPQIQDAPTLRLLSGKYWQTWSRSPRGAGQPGPLDLAVAL